MADIKISQLPEVSSVSPGDVLPVVASGVTSKIQAQNFVNSVTSSQAVSASYALTASYALNGGGAATPTFPYTGSAVISGSLTVTGSFSVSSGLTGSLFGTASWARNSLTASFVTASNVWGPFGSNSVISSSYAVTSSYALVAQSIINDVFPYTGSVRVTGSIIVTGSVSATQGFTGSLLGTSSWAINTSNAITSQTSSYSDNFTINSTNLNTQTNLDVDLGTETVASASSTAYSAAFFDYIVNNGSDYRSGTVFSVWNSSGTVRYTDYSTTDIGNTSDVTFTVGVSGGFALLRASVSSNNWSVKTFVRTI